MSNWGVYACCPGATPPQIVANPMVLSFQQFLGNPTGQQTVSVTGTNLVADIVVVCPTGYEVSLDGITWSSTPPFVIPQTGGSASATLYVRLNSTSAGAYNGSVDLSSTGVSTVNIALTGLCLNPTLVASPTSLNFTKHNPLVSASQNFTLSGFDLVGSVNLNVGTAYEISLDNINFFPSLTLVPTGMILSPTIVYVRFIETVEGVYNQNVACTSPSCPTLNVAMNGNYEILNAYEFMTGMVPTIAFFQLNYVPSILNPQIVGDTIYFDNASWVPILSNKWASSNLVSIVSSQTEIKRDYPFSANLISYRGKNGIVDNSSGMFPNCTSLVNIDAKFLQIQDTNFQNIPCSDFRFMKDCVSMTHNNFNGCTNMTDLDLSGMLNPNVGSSSADDGNFTGISLQTINVKAKLLHQTNNAGLMDGDYDTLNINNTVIFNWVP